MVNVFQMLVLGFYKKTHNTFYIFKKRRNRFLIQIPRPTFHFSFVLSYLPRKISAWYWVEHYAFLHIKSWIFKYRIKIVVLQSLVLSGPWKEKHLHRIEGSLVVEDKLGITKIAWAMWSPWFYLNFIQEGLVGRGALFRSWVMSQMNRRYFKVLPWPLSHVHNLSPWVVWLRLVVSEVICLSHSLLP